MSSGTFALYFGNRGFFPESLIAGARRDVRKAVAGLGFETLMMPAGATPHGAVESVADGRKYARFLEEHRGEYDGVILCLPNFGDETGAIAALQDCGTPILIHAYPDELDKMGFATRRDAFCGKFSIMDVFCQYGLPFTAFKPHTVHPGSPAFAEHVNRFAAVCRVVKAMKRMTVGAIGARTTAFKTVRFDEVTLQKYGITTETIDLSDVMLRVRGMRSTQPACRAKARRLRGYTNWRGVPKRAFDTLVKLGVALDDLAAEYSMDALSLRCWLELEKDLGVSPCVLLSEMNDRGLSAACELDVGNAIPMYALSRASGLPATCLDWNNNYGDDPDRCILFHCGPVPQTLMTGKGRIIEHPMFVKALGPGCAFGCNVGRIAPNPMTFASSKTQEGKLEFYVGEGEFTADPVAEDFFGCAGVARVAGLQDWLQAVGYGGYRHHVSVTVGHVAASVREAFARYLKYDLATGMSLLGIDLGTSGCKAAAFDAGGRRLAQAYREYPTLYPREGWAELDSRDVWRKTCEVIREVAAQTAGDPITALATSAFGEGFVPVTRGREMLRNTILCVDARGEDHVAELLRALGQEAFYRINPNLLGPQYSLPKMLWMREAEPEIFDRADYFLLWGDVVGFMLGGDAVTVNSQANRTLLLDLEQNDWSDALLAWSRIPREKLGRVLPGGVVSATVSAAAARDLGLPPGVRVVTGGHDQCCNALGCGAVRAGHAVCGIGSFECITPVYRKVADPLAMLRNGLNMEHHALPGLYVSFLYNQAGTLVKWLRDTFAAADRPPDGQDLYDALNPEMPDEPTRLLTLPHFEPCLWPRYIADSGGVILGLHTRTTRGEILKSIMECETLYFADSIQALRELGVDTAEFVASGGGARSDRWLQIKADIFGVPFVRPRETEGGVLGAAMLAGLATGAFSGVDEAVARFVERDRAFVPDARRHAQYREKLGLYRELFPATEGLLRRLSQRGCPGSQA